MSTLSFEEIFTLAKKGDADALLFLEKAWIYRNSARAPKKKQLKCGTCPFTGERELFTKSGGVSRCPSCHISFAERERLRREKREWEKQHWQLMKIKKMLRKHK